MKLGQGDSQMNIEDDAGPVEPTTGKDEDGLPYCVIHHVRMRNASSGKKGSPTSYYKCPVPKCGETAKRLKLKVPRVVPSSPTSCPRCSTEKKPVYCERDKVLSDAMKIILACPECGWKSGAQAVPQLASEGISRLGRKRSQDSEGLGDR